MQHSILYNSYNTQLKSLYKFSYKFLFPISDVAHGRHHRRNANRLDILPRGPHTFPIGKNSFFTCRAHVHNPGLVKNLKWLAPNGMEIPQDDRYDTIFLFLSIKTMFYISKYTNKK